MLEPRERAAPEAHSTAGHGLRRAQEQGVVGEVRFREHIELPVAEHQASPDLPVAARSSALRTLAPGRDPRPGVVPGPRDGATRARDLRHQRIRVDPETRGDVVLMLEHQPVGRPPNHSVELDADPEEQIVLRAEVSGIDDRCRDPDRVEHPQVAQTAFPLLQVGFQPMRHVTLLLVTLAADLFQDAEPGAGTTDPPFTHIAEQPVAELGVAGDRSPVEQAEDHLQVVGRDRDRFPPGADGVIQRDPGVPDRVPQPLRHLPDVAAALVHEHQIEVAGRREVPATECAAGHERDARLAADQLADPLVHEVRIGRRERSALQICVRDERGTLSREVEWRRGGSGPGEHSADPTGRVVR